MGQTYIGGFNPQASTPGGTGFPVLSCQLGSV